MPVIASADVFFDPPICVLVDHVWCYRLLAVTPIRNEQQTLDDLSACCHGIIFMLLGDIFYLSLKFCAA